MSHTCIPACTAGWTPGSKCHCTGCGNNFGSVTLFDRHRKNDQCLNPGKFRDVTLDDRSVYRVRPSLEISDRFYPR